MEYFAENLHRPIRIQGQEIVLVPEVVGPVPITEQHEYVELVSATNVRPAISVREADIEQARENYSGLPVYGMWHTLIESGVISFNHTLQIIARNELDGFYLFSDVGRANYSGVYEAGFFAADASFSLEDAIVVDPVLDQLVLPEQEAKLAKEILAERRNTLRAAWTSLGMAVMFTVLLGFVTDFVLKQAFAHRYATLENKSELLKDVRLGLQELRNTRLTEVPNNSVVLERIASIWALDKSIRTKNDQNFQNANHSFNVSNIQANPEYYLSWADVKARADGSWQVSFKEK